MDALIHLKGSRDMVKKRFPPSEYGANYPDLGIASEARHSSHLSVELSSLRECTRHQHTSTGAGEWGGGDTAHRYQLCCGVMTFDMSSLPEGGTGPERAKRDATLPCQPHYLEVA